MQLVISNINSPFGFKELEGIPSYRFGFKTNIRSIQVKIQYFDPELNESYVPYVVETSVGLDRLFLSILSSALLEEELASEKLEPFKFSLLH